jgi:hypothetical protein
MFNTNQQLLLTLALNTNQSILAVETGSHLKNIYKGVDVVEWSRALDVRLSEWCCSVTMVWVQIPSREEQKFDIYIFFKCDPVSTANID